MLSAWSWSSGFCLSTGLLLLGLGRKTDLNQVFRREAFAVVGLSWILCGIFGALPFPLSGVGTMWDGLFEAYSGFTTTGATVFRDIGQLASSLVLWRSVMQWMGGMGIVVLFVAIFGFMGVGGKSLFQEETSSLAQDDFHVRMHSLSLYYLALYFGFSFIGALGLFLMGLSPFDAINHAMTAISTGGFSPHNESVGYFGHWYVEAWLTVVMLMGGIGFPLHYRMVFLRKKSIYISDEEVRTYFFIVLGSSLVVAGERILRGELADQALHVLCVDSIFTVASVITTTGFTSSDFSLWPVLSQLLLLGLMISGGCAGSTAGGIKVARILVFMKEAYRQLRLVYHPRLVIRLRLNGKILEDSMLQGVTFYFALYFLLLVAGIFLLSLLEPKLDIISVVSAVFASLNNVGPGLMEVGPSGNYAFFNPASKMWLSLLMLVGRLEIYAIVLLFVPRFWKRF